MISCQSKSHGKIHKYYQCPVSANKGSKICKTNLVRKEEAEEAVFYRIQEIVKQPEIIKKFIVKVEQETNVDTSSLEENLKNLNKELNIIHKKKKENLELEFEGNIDIETLQERLKYIKDREQKIIKQIDSIQEKIESINRQTLICSYNNSSYFRKFCVEIFKKAKVEDKKALYASIIESISVTPGDTTDSRKVDK